MHLVSVEGAQCLLLQRVGNGWIVRVSNYGNPQETTAELAHVAETPSSLLMLVEEWARPQDEAMRKARLSDPANEHGRLPAALRPGSHDQMIGTPRPA